MSVKAHIRSVLPATTRNFEHNTKDILDQLDFLRGETCALRSEGRSIASATDSLLDRFSALEQDRNRPSYCNLEYLTLNREYTGRRILLAGWYGSSNCGDELMMRTMLQHLEGRGARVSVLLWDDPDYDFSRLPAHADQIHYPRSTWELRQLAEYFDVLVWGGGAIIDERQFTHDPKNINTGNLLIWLSEEMQKRGKDVYAVGLSANESLLPVTEFARRLDGVIRGCCHVSLRDDYSLESLRMAGVDVSHIELCEDIVFGNRSIGRPALAKSDGVRTVGVVLMLGDVTADHNERVLPRIIASTRERFGAECRIRLIPFYNFWKFDTTLIKELCDKLGISGDVEIAPYTDILEDSAILDCDAVVAYRYHACLVSAASGIPTLFMCVDGHPHYRNKMRHIAEVFGMADYLLMTSTCLDDGSFDAGFASLLEGECVPKASQGIFVATSEFLERICDSIAGSRP